MGTTADPIPANLPPPVTLVPAPSPRLPSCSSHSLPKSQPPHTQPLLAHPAQPLPPPLTLVSQPPLSQEPVPAPLQQQPMPGLRISIPSQPAPPPVSSRHTPISPMQVAPQMPFATKFYLTSQPSALTTTQPLLFTSSQLHGQSRPPVLLTNAMTTSNLPRTSSPEVLLVNTADNREKVAPSTKSAILPHVVADLASISSAQVGRYEFGIDQENLN